jgi:serine/threonine protein phosphatase PrpC
MYVFLLIIFSFIHSFIHLFIHYSFEYHHFLNCFLFQIVLQLEKNLALYDTVEEALSESFITANSALENTPIKYMTSGSTCVSVYMRGDEYWVANCGDSRAVLASWNHTSGELEAHSLSRDHKPDDPVEMNRIEACGGFVSPSPLPGLSARVYLDPEFTMIGLAMARSLGSE